MSLAERLAALKARRVTAPAPPSTDAAELVESFRAVPATAPVWSPEQRLKGAWIAVIDTETTGIDPAVDRIVEIAVVLVDGLGLPGVEPVVALSMRLNPGVPIPEKASQVHGITDADVVGCPTFAEAWPKIVEVVGERTPAAFNAPFDCRMLAGEVSRLGLGLGALSWGRWLDPMVLARGLDKFESGKKLTDVARRRGVALSAHGGAGDAVATAVLMLMLILEALVGKRGFKAPEFPTLATWLPWQRDQALAQEVDLVAYLRKSGERTACDPEIVSAAPQAEVIDRRGDDLAENPPGLRVGLVLGDGSVAHGYLDPAGSLSGRVSHWITCDQAAKGRAA